METTTYTVYFGYGNAVGTAKGEQYGANDPSKPKYFIPFIHDGTNDRSLKVAASDDTHTVYKPNTNGSGFFLSPGKCIKKIYCNNSKTPGAFGNNDQNNFAQLDLYLAPFSQNTGDDVLEVEGTLITYYMEKDFQTSDGREPGHYLFKDTNAAQQYEYMRDGNTSGMALTTRFYWEFSEQKTTKSLAGKYVGVYVHAPGKSILYNGGPTEYKIDVEDYIGSAEVNKGEYGIGVTIEGDPTKIGPGKTIKLIPTGEKGYRCTGFTHKLKDNPTADCGTVDKNADGSFTFTMPAAADDVILTAQWEHVLYTIEGHTDPKNVGSITVPQTAYYHDKVTVTCDPMNIEYGPNRFIAYKRSDPSKLIGVTMYAGRKSGSFIMPDDNVVVFASFISHKIKWRVQHLEVAQNDYKLIFTESGYAEDNFSRPLDYNLYKENSDKTLEYITHFSSVDNKMQAEYTLSDADIEQTYKFIIIAENTIKAQGASIIYTILPVHRTVGYYTNNQMQECIPYYHDGQNWQEVEVYIYKDNAWQLCSIS